MFQWRKSAFQVGNVAGGRIGGRRRWSWIGSVSLQDILHLVRRDGDAGGLAPGRRVEAERAAESLIDQHGDAAIRNLTGLV